MPTNNPGDKARAQLLELEKRRQLAVISEFRKIQVRLQSEIIDILERIDKQRRIDGNASPGLLIQKARLNELLDAVTDEVRDASARLAAITGNAQNAAVDIAQNQATKYPQIKTDLNFFDGPATRELIGIAGDGNPLAKHFAKLAAPARQAMFDALFFGIAAGRPNQAIARELRDAIGGTTAAAMTIVRTETNRAYREATRQFYVEAPGVIGWRWLAALDLNTCPICWALHGTIFKTKTKFGTHPNCRCTMVPVFAGDPPVETGPEIFARLNDAQKRAILGPGRLGLYQQGAQLSDFVELNKSVFGIGRQVKPISRTTFKPGPPRPPMPPFPNRPVVTPTPALPPATAPKPALPAGSTKQIAFSAKKIRKEFADAAIVRRVGFIDRSDDLTKAVSAAHKDYYHRPVGILQGETDRLMDNLQKARDAVTENVRRVEGYAVADRKALQTPTGIKIEPQFDDRRSFPKTKPERKDRVLMVVDELNKLIDATAWPNKEKRLWFKHIKGRAHYIHTERTVRVNLDAPREIRTIAHEIAHGLEKSNADNLQAANDFLNYRTRGEVPVRLKKLRPNQYRSNEMTRPDKFADPYVGKLYGTVGNQNYTEVISMGVEQMFADPLKFAQEDPEYFDFILTILRGEKWIKPAIRIKL